VEKKVVREKTTPMLARRRKSSERERRYRSALTWSDKHRYG
jgi:hypothetical protein